jgi:hypothetical protein
MYSVASSKNKNRKSPIPTHQEVQGWLNEVCDWLVLVKYRFGSSEVTDMYDVARNVHFSMRIGTVLHLLSSYPELVPDYSKCPPLYFRERASRK